MTVRRRIPFGVVRLACTCLLAALLPAANAGPSQRAADAVRPDLELVRLLQGLGRTPLNAALDATDRLVAEHPNFRLAHLVRADLLVARARTGATPGNLSDAAKARMDELRAEAFVRLRAASERPAEDRVPSYLLQLSPKQRHALVVDASRSRVYLYEHSDGAPKLVDDFYASLGKQGIGKDREGDRRTPVGVYQVVTFVPGTKLPDLYGWGAFPISYPNTWDSLLGRTGSGIWLHGVPSDSYARAPRASDGCVVLANIDMERIARRIQIGETPVIISDEVRWVSNAVRDAERQAFMGVLESWRKAWESRDSDDYLVHYTRGFRSGRLDFTAWSAHKRRVNSTKKAIKVMLDNVSVYRSPAAENLVEITFDQDYRSDNFAQHSRKRQYWVMEAGRWKIAHEGPVGAPKLALPESYRLARR